MVSLTHVCMWSDNGWKSVTAEEAAKLHPGGHASANSGLFMCELCGQYVTLTRGDKRKSYFKHSASEANKDCPERTFAAGRSIPYDEQEHDLPIRVTNVSAYSFEFEVGLVRAPIGSLGGDFRIEIKPKGVLGESYVFSKERLNCEGITYLPIGKRPFEKYTLGFQNGNEKLREFWPKEIEGVDPNGTLFEKTSGKKLICDADVEIGKEYYLLKRNYLHKKSNGSIRVEQIAKQQFGWERWYLYLVSADAFDEESARFYLDFHCRLTDSPVSMQPIWPLFVEGNYLIKHNESSIYMLVTGNVMAFATFPPRKVRRFEGGASQMKLCRASCSARQQLISTGRTRALQYIYFWKEPLDKEGMQPTFSVTDLKGADAAPGVTDTLPYKKTLIFKSEFDGEIIIYKNNFAVDKRKISADKYVETDGLVYGLSVELVIGLDVVWKIEFKKRKSVVDDEAEIMRQIADVSGAVIPTPHCLWNIMLGMGAYPNVCRRIKKCIRSGSINEKSYRRLQNIYKRVNMNREGDTI